MIRDPATTLAQAISRGATVLAPDGRDVSQAVRTSFNRLLPVCGGDRGAAAAQAVQAAISHREDGP